MKQKLHRICVGGFVITSLGVVVASLLALGARLWWPLELLTHFPLQYIFLLVPVTLGLFVAKRRRLATVSTVCLLWNLILILPVYLLSSSKPNSGPESLRLMAVNVKTSNRRFDRFLEVVKTERPDVLVVLEVDNQWVDELARLRDDYPYSKTVPRQDNFGIALFSKRPLEVARVRYLGDAKVPSIEIQARVNGRRLTILGTHPLPPVGRNAARRNEQLAAIAKLVSNTKGPVVVAGDLNITPWSPYFKDLLRQSGLRDSRRGFGFLASWPSRLGVLGIPIDHILVSPEVFVHRRWVAGETGSDHLPVVADLLIGEGKDPAEP